VGHLHIMFLMEEAIKNSLKEFDFMIGAEEYKYRWHALERANYQVIILRRSFLSQLRLRQLDAILLLGLLRRYGLQESFRRYLRRKRQKRGGTK